MDRETRYDSNRNVVGISSILHVYLFVFANNDSSVVIEYHDFDIPRYHLKCIPCTRKKMDIL